jgi:UrcA family protein
MRLFPLAIPAAALAFTLLAPAAWSRPPQLVGKVHVELKGLDLQNPADASTLLNRLNHAAYRACGGDPKQHDSYRTRPEQTVRVYEECRENAVKRAIDQIGAPLLVRLYADEQRLALNEPLSEEWSPAAGCDTQIRGTATGRPTRRSVP